MRVDFAIMHRALIAPVALAGLMGAAPPVAVMNLPSYGEPATPWPNVDAATSKQACRDRIEQVRAAEGRPKLERAPPDPDKPLLMYAVDKRLDDCTVIVPVADPGDVRQLPEPGPLEIVPLVPGK